MQVDNHLGSMLASQMQVSQSASNIARAANAIGDPEFSEAAQDIVSSMVEQIPQVIAYEVNAQGIKMQEAALGTLLDIKA